MTIFKQKISATMAGLLMVGCMQMTAIPSKANVSDEGTDSNVAIVSDATPSDATPSDAESEINVLPELRITSETTSVTVGDLPSFTVDLETEHASIEYEGKTGWAYKYASELDWHGFGYNPLIAKADGARHYALGVCIFTDKEYILKNGTTKIIFNGVDVTTSTMSCISERPWGGFVYIDLGMAVKETLEGWQQIAGKWQFFVDGEPKTGWICDEDKWYFMDAAGIMQTGWVSSGNKWYYLASSGVMTTGWKQIKNKWYYFNTNGVMVTGWKQINNKWYHFNTSGAMATGWNLINNKWYYFNADGAMQTGWQKYNNEWYYLTADGVMTTGWLKYKNEWYYFKASGAMVTGKQVINGKTYNFNSSGVWVN